MRAPIPEAGGCTRRPSSVAALPIASAGERRYGWADHWTIVTFSKLLSGSVMCCSASRPVAKPPQEPSERDVAQR
jgi:hypothetical protein